MIAADGDPDASSSFNPQICYYTKQDSLLCISNIQIDINLITQQMSDIEYHS
jgi:hypothetical protein